MCVTDLELALCPGGAGCMADARLTQPGTQADAALCSAVPVALNPAALLALSLDPAAYDRTLIAQLFADQALRDIWRIAHALADGADRSRWTASSPSQACCASLQPRSSSRVTRRLR
jgi:hypothetical protein